MVGFCFLLTGGKTWGQSAASSFSMAGTTPHFRVLKHVAPYNRIQLKGEGSMNSTALTSDFMKPFVLGGHLDPVRKQQVVKKLKRFNLAGADLNGELLYHRTFRKDTTRPERQNYRYTVTAGDYFHYNLRFSDKAFHMLFYGNKAFEGDTAQLAGFHYQAWRYQKIGLNLARSGNRFSWMAGLFLLKGSNHTELEIDDARLYTAPHGHALALDLHMRYDASDAGSHGLNAWNGYGVAVDAGIEFFDPTWGTFTLQAENMGAINWNKRSVHRNVDSSYRFRGIPINRLLHAKGPVLRAGIDSLANSYGGTSHTGAYTRPTPGYLRLHYHRVLSSVRMVVSSGIAFRIASNYAPLFHCAAHWVRNGYFLYGRFAYGGYGGPALGMGGGLHFLKYFYLDVSAHHLEGLMLPKQHIGRSLSAALSYRF